MDTITREASRNRDLPIEKQQILGKNETEEKDIDTKFYFWIGARVRGCATAQRTEGH